MIVLRHPLNKSPNIGIETTLCLLEFYESLGNLGDIGDRWREVINLN